MMNTKLNLEPNIANADDFYQMLIDAHQGLSDEASQAMNAKLILLLANHIGDIDVLRHAVSIAAATSANQYAT